MARPKINIDDNQLRNLCRYKPRLKDVADFFECSEDTIERYIKKNFKKTFAEFRDQNMVHTRFSIIQTAIDEAVNKRKIPMIIFCLKNLCGWKDKIEHSGDQENPIVPETKMDLSKLSKEELELLKPILEKVWDAN